MKLVTIFLISSHPFQYYKMLRRAMTTMSAMEFPYDWEREQQRR
jgi:hypothetical protein